MLTQTAFAGVSVVHFCERCKRPLSNPISMQTGMGPVCRGHVNARKGDDVKHTDFSDEFDDAISLTDALVMQHIDGKVRTNVPHLVTHHSPDGFEFGYPGSGSADLALNLCEWYLKEIGYRGQRTDCWDGTCFSMAYALHQDFKQEFIAQVPHDGGSIPIARISGWFSARMTDELVELYALRTTADGGAE